MIDPAIRIVEFALNLAPDNLLPSTKQGKFGFPGTNSFLLNAHNSQSPERTNLSLGGLFGYVQRPTHGIGEYFSQSHRATSRPTIFG